MTNLKIAISACLLGEKVRYDGGHKRCDVIAKEGIPHLELQAICPEVAIGLGVPRPTLHLTTNGSRGVAMVTNESGKDYTVAMQEWASDAVQGLHEGRMSGLILKSRSPSCGIGDVSIEVANHMVPELGSGLFAAAVQETAPGLPLINEVGINDKGLRDEFLASAFAYQRARNFLGEYSNRVKLPEFHQVHKSYLKDLANGEENWVERLLHQANSSTEEEVFRQYGAFFLARANFGITESRLLACFNQFVEMQFLPSAMTEQESIPMQAECQRMSTLYAQERIGQIVSQQGCHLWIHRPSVEEAEMRRYFLG